MTNRERILDKYDALVYESREAGFNYQHGITYINDMLAAEWAGHTVEGLDVPDLIFTSVRYHVQSARGTRRQTLKDRFEDLADKAEFPPGTREHDAAVRRLEANFHRAFPLGADEGVDKALGMWGVRDIQAAVWSRAENLKKQQIAMSQFEDAAHRAIRALEEGEAWA